jgi:hypothetical protein
LQVARAEEAGTDIEWLEANCPEVASKRALDELKRRFAQGGP